MVQTACQLDCDNSTVQFNISLQVIALLCCADGVLCFCLDVLAPLYTTKQIRAATSNGTDIIIHGMEELHLELLNMQFCNPENKANFVHNFS
jgi:hypothetical protein